MPTSMPTFGPTFGPTSSPSTLRRIAAAATAISAGCVLVLLAPAGSAAVLADSTVTIRAEGTDLSGTVKSPRAACKKSRNVIVYKQVGTRGGGDDLRFAFDTTDSDGDWNTGNTGTEGRFYAKVKRTDLCKADFSRTIRATR